MSAEVARVDRFDITLDPGWGYRDKMHGGYSLAATVRAAMRVANRALHPYPVAMSAQYAASPAPGPATVVVRTLRAGRTVGSYQLSLEQDGVPCVEVLLTAGRLPAAGEAPRWSANTPMPTLPPPERCLGGEEHETRRDAEDRMTVRMDPQFGPPPWGSGEIGELRGWLRCLDPDPVYAAIILADGLPPVTYALGITGWAPTLQLQVLLRQVPRPGWFVASQTGTLLAGGFVDEDCTLWDPASGAVLAQARQIAGYRER